MEQLKQVVFLFPCHYCVFESVTRLKSTARKNLLQESCFFADSLSATHGTFMYTVIKNWIIG